MLQEARGKEPAGGWKVRGSGGGRGGGGGGVRQDR